MPWRSGAGCIWRIAMLVCGALGLLGGLPAGAEPGRDGGGRQLLLQACVQCHGLRPVELTRDGPGGWRDTVDRMIVFGAQLDAAEAESLVGFLASQYGPGAEPMTTGPLPPGAGPAGDAGLSLPAGDGRALVASLCTGCHDAGRIVATRRSDDSWARYVRGMLAQGSIAAGEEQVESMVVYLQANFGRQR